MNAPALPYAGLLPVFLLVGGALAVLLLDAFWKGASRFLGWATAAIFASALAALFRNPVLTGDGTGTLFQHSGVYAAFAALVLLGGLGATLLAIPYLGRQGFLRGEFFALLLFSASGGVLLAAAANLLFLFLALEILTVPLYVLAGYYRTSERSMEAALKYFLVGIFCSAFLLYGIAMFYGATGTLDLARAQRVATALAVSGSPILRLSLGLMLVGIGFKVAAVPFHFWAPDVYQGAPTPVTVFLAVGSKVGGFAFAWKVLLLGFPGLAAVWTGALSLIAIVTLIVGALLAMLQEDIKRLLAWSSVAHAGYGLIALIADGRMLQSGPARMPEGPSGTEALLVYLLIYAVNVTGAFAVVSWLERTWGGPVRIEDYDGLSRRHPVMAALMAIFFLSLAGMPPAAGFVGKYVLFWAAIRAGAWSVAIVGVLTAVVGMYYYLSVVMAMYFKPLRGEAAVPRTTSPAVALAIAGAALCVAVLGVWPGPVLNALWGALRSSDLVVAALSAAGF